MYLNEGFKNRCYVVSKMHLDKKLKLKLKRMQIVEGSKIQIIQKNKPYPFLIEYQMKRIAFSQKIAEKIEVIPCD